MNKLASILIEITLAIIALIGVFIAGLCVG